MNGMNMPTSYGNTTSEMMMVPYLHITGGDHLFFKPWQPSSTGAIAGACIGLAALAILERSISGMRGRLEGYWRRRALVMSAGKPVGDSSYSGNCVSNTDVKEVAAVQRQRTSPPFILAHDLPRGIIHLIQSALSYALMLAVMTFNATYIISIILGLGIGEVVFGRWGDGGRVIGH